mmetsp:Transcript_13496/g.31951  ORF Transcript_13496/g.31951 Transcript_13496/m.31951 type:complete len:267 (+) Transcript_13496:594-1394(+)
MARSPWNTSISTASWLSSMVVNSCDFLVGTTVFREMILDMTSPSVAIPRVSGVTSRSRMSLVSSPPSPERMPPWTAAPYATASSGLTPLLGVLPLKKSRRSDWILGIRVEPPTSTSSFTCFFSRPESRSTFSTGSIVLRKRSMLSSSNLARLSVSERSVSAKKDSISMRWVVVVERARLARSTSRRSFCTARLSLEASLPVFFLKRPRMWSIVRRSKSSPPRWVSPEVATTSNTPLEMVKSDTSKVPPPRSNTRMFSSSSFVLSRP